MIPANWLIDNIKISAGGTIPIIPLDSCCLLEHARLFITWAVSLRLMPRLALIVIPSCDGNLLCHFSHFMWFCSPVWAAILKAVYCHWTMTDPGEGHNFMILRDTDIQQNGMVEASGSFTKTHFEIVALIRLHSTFVHSSRYRNILSV